MVESKTDLRASVIITTYNSPEHLRRVLLGFSHQNTQGFEVVVAVDGYEDSTLALVQEFQQTMPQPLRYVAHNHCGFRKTRILNQAIRASRSDYLIFSDGDCIPRFDFVSEHLTAARIGRFVSGGTIRLTRDVTSQIKSEDVAAGYVHFPTWLTQRGMLLSRKWHWLQKKRWLAVVADTLTSTRATFNGHNSSAWKQDVLNVNGFDERMGYGGLDRELGERLKNSGVRGIQLRHRAICVHLDHDRNYISPEVLLRNRRIRLDTRRRRLTWTDYGLKRDIGTPTHQFDSQLHVPCFAKT
jgi:glycosyltransferase involved in cell wall biosynthesis